MGLICDTPISSKGNELLDYETQPTCPLRDTQRADCICNNHLDNMVFCPRPLDQATTTLDSKMLGRYVQFSNTFSPAGQTFVTYERKTF